MIQLRQYQQECLDAIWENCNRNIVACLPTGAGKSHVIAEFIRRATEQFPGTKIAVVTHTKELVQQDFDKILLHAPLLDVGIYCAGLGEKQLSQITVASIQSIFRQADCGFEIIIIDEAHRIPASGEGQYLQFIAAHPNARVIGFTATPYRLGGGYIYGDERLFESLVYEARTCDLIQAGYLAPIASFAGSKKADLEGVHIQRGDFNLAEMSARFEDEGLVEAAVSDLLTKAANRKAILIFGCTVKHCEMIVDQARAMLPGDTIALVTGKTPKAERFEIIEQFKARKIRILVNCDVLTTGFDAPHVDCVALLRATASPGLYVQIVGRGLRIADGKTDCLLLDYGGNVSRHGLIDQIAIRSKNEGTKDRFIECPVCGEFISASSIKHSCGWIKPRKCWNCDAVYPITEDVCPSCGAGRPARANHAVEAAEIDPITGIGGAVPKEVFDIEYRVHKKEGKPPSLRVTYFVDKYPPYGSQISEWVCFEHTGFPRRKAVMWCAQRGIENAPNTVSEAVKMIWPKPERIWCKRDGKYWRIIDYDFTEESIQKAEAKRLKAQQPEDEVFIQF